MKHAEFKLKKELRLKTSENQRIINSREFQIKRQKQIIQLKAIQRKVNESIINNVIFENNKSLTTNHGELEMLSAIKLYKEEKKVNNFKSAIEEIISSLEKESDIEKLISIMEKFGLLLLRLNSRKNIEKWEKYHIDSEVKEISNISIHYEEIKNSSLSQKCKYAAFNNMKKQIANIVKTLKEKYNIED